MKQQRIKVYGPPGTGKTTYCLDLLCEHLAAGDRVLFISFTKAAQEEAHKRLIRMFGEVPEHARVSTIHALCLRMLNIGTECLADKPRNKGKFFDYLGLKAHHGRLFNMAVAAIGMHNRARNIGNHAATIYDAPNCGDPYAMLEIIKRYDHWKYHEGYVDFTDLLIRVVNEEGEVPKHDVVIIDEAQDLTTLQWYVAERIYAKASTVYVVGDDDQSVYSFLGADVNRFLSWRADAIRVLEQSYRLPWNILAYSQFLAKRIIHRQDKIVRGLDKYGPLYQGIHTLEDINYGVRPTEMYLCRNNYMMAHVAKILFSRGVPYHGYRSPFTDKMSHAGRVFAAIGMAHKWRTEPLDIKDWRKFRKLTRETLRGMIEERFPGATDASMPSIAPLNKIFPTLDMDKSGWWNVFFPSLSAKLEAGFKLALQNYGLEKCSHPTMALTTIHGSKGKEADRVYVCGTITNKLARTLDTHDDEHRLFYVALTRTKNELLLIHDRVVGGRQYRFPIYNYN